MSHRARRSSPIDVLEAAHRLAPTLDDWLAGLTERAMALDQGCGVMSIVQRRATTGVTTLGIVAQGPEWLPAFSTTASSSASERMLAELWRRLIFTGSSRAVFANMPRPDFDAFFDTQAGFGVHDVWGIAAQDGDGALLAITWPAAHGEEPKGFRRWRRIAMHLSAGLRLHLHQADSGARFTAAEAEAVLSPEGKLLHAEGAAVTNEARLRLSNGVRAARHARADTDEEAAMDLWQALVSGRWTLTDVEDSDGKRLVMAFPAPLDFESPWRLTEREGAIVRWVLDGAQNKEIAYAMGIATSTVSSHLVGAMRKLRVRNRAELKVLAARTLKLAASGTVELSTDLATTELDPSVQSQLTRTQRELIGHLAAGRTNAEIAALRQTSVLTVRNLVQRLMHKLGAGSRSELARLAVGPG